MKCIKMPLIGAILLFGLLQPNIANADVTILKMANDLGKNEKPEMSLRVVIEPLNTADSILSVQEIKSTIESALATKSFQPSEQSETTLAISFKTMKNKMDFSAYVSLEVKGAKKTTASGLKYQQQLWSGEFIFSYEDKKKAILELSNVMDVFIKSYLPSVTNYEVGQIINMGGKDYRVVPNKPGDPNYDPKDPLGLFEKEIKK